jgi:hypothetical protein
MEGYFMLTVIKRMVQTELRNDSNENINITIKGVGSKTLYPGDSMKIDNGTRYKALAED